MKRLKLLAALSLIGGTLVGCGYETRTTYEPSPSTRYVMAPTYSSGYTTHYVVSEGYSPGYYGSSDSDRDGVPNWSDRRPNNPYRY